MHAVYELKEKLCDELEEYGKKTKLDVGALDIVDKLAHTIKNLDKIIECYEDKEYSSDYGESYDGGRGGMRGMSYARGGRGGNRGGRRGANQYGSYATGRYSGADNEMLVTELRELMEDAPDERTKMEFKKFIQKMEQM